MEFVWFIPNTVLAAYLTARPGATLAHLCAESGAVDAIYRREEMPWVVRLEDPKMDAGVIHELWANQFANCGPVWVTEDEVRPGLKVVTNMDGSFSFRGKLPPGMGF